MRELQYSLLTMATMLLPILQLRSYPFRKERGIENWVYATIAAGAIILVGLFAYYFLVIAGGTSTTTTYH